MKKKKAIESEALLTVENELALSTRDWKYKATVRSSARRGLRGIIKETIQETKSFQGPTYAREVDPVTCANADMCKRPANATSTGSSLLISLPANQNLWGG